MRTIGPMFLYAMIERAKEQERKDMTDVYGIRRHINRETAQLEDFFSPRCTARVKERYEC